MPTKVIPAIALAVALAGLFGCDGTSSVQAPQRSLDAMTMHASDDAQGGKPDVDPTYANGETVYMIGPHLIPNARETQPNLYEKAEELYLVAYPQQTLPVPGVGPITLPSGYQPQCNPCFHPGLPPMFVFHDHIITGAPGHGNNGTAGEFKAPWKLIVLVYDPVYVSSPNFKPITSATDLDAAEAAGNVFMKINPGGDNEYEFDTGNVLICPIVSSHA
jgi:hypothetical protein